MSGTDLYEELDLVKPRRKVRLLDVATNPPEGMRAAYMLADEDTTDFVLVFKANTESAVELKKKRIPFQVYQPKEIPLVGCPDSVCLDAQRLVEKILGNTVLAVTDKKRLKDGPWLDPFEGQDTNEKLAFLVRDLFGRVLPYTNSLVFTAVRGMNWELSGYLLNCAASSELKTMLKTIDAFREKHSR